MEKAILCFILFISTQICFTQPAVSFTIGGTNQADYLSTIAYENQYEMIIVEASIHGKQFRFILDTGAPMTISTDLFNELKPAIVDSIPIADVNQSVQSVSVVMLDEVVFGGISFKEVPAIVAGKAMPFECFQVDGILGSNLLANSVVQFSEKHRTITITNDVERLALDMKQSVNLFLNDVSQPYIWINLMNKGKAKEKILFDTGMGGLYSESLFHLNKKKLRIFKLLGTSEGNNSIGFHGAGGNTLHHKMILPELEVNGARFKNITVTSTIDSYSRIGNKLLEYGAVTIDYKNRKFYFAPFPDKHYDLSEKTFPVDFIPRDNHLYIGLVWDTSLEDLIRVGDQVLTINSINYENISLCDAIKLKPAFKNPEKITMTIKKETGEIKEVILAKM